jgi:hypothetical protein
MRKYWIVPSTLLLVLLAFVFVLPWAQVAAQQPAGGVKVTPTTVTRVILIKVNPGQRPAFDQDVMDNVIPVYEEEKKAGIITNYEIFNNVTTNGPNDWGVGIGLTYPNYATLDNLGDRTDPITLKHYGSAEKRQAAADHRNQITTVVSSRLRRTIRYSRQATGSN